MYISDYFHIPIKARLIEQTLWNFTQSATAKQRQVECDHPCERYLALVVNTAVYIPIEGAVN
jgi:hypothetical protein